MNRRKKLLYNTAISLIYQLIALICAFFLPRYILAYYGSAVNGLVSSITQFLGFISLAECGVGTVVQSALYKPLADKNEDDVSRIVVSSERFFRKIAIILCIYTVALMATYPFITIDDFSYIYTASLILIISASSFSRYYFSMTYRLLLDADQMAFVQLLFQAITTILSTVFGIIFMRFGAGIHAVELVIAVAFLIQPIALNAYVKHHYHLNRNIILNGEPIKQKWNGLAQHIAWVVLENTDSVILTLFSTLENVSVYAVYQLVINGIRQIVLSLTTGIQSMLGDMYAKKEMRALSEAFGWAEWLLHFVVMFVFICTGILILPFVQVYTLGVSDAEYIVPVYAVLISAAWGAHSLRLPYNIMVLAAGHYKQTQWSAIIEAVINITVSMALIYKFGLIGVALGTFVAMLYRTTYLAWYLSKAIIYRNIKHYIKHMLVDAGCIAIAAVIMQNFELPEISYAAWIIMAIKVAAVTIAVVFAMNAVFYPGYTKNGICIAVKYFVKSGKKIARMIRKLFERSGRDMQDK